MLGATVTTFEELPGLLVMVPAAIGLRGNIFGTFGNRISTSIHTGTYSTKLKPETVLGQNVIASMSLTMILSVVLALVATGMTVIFGVSNAIGWADLVLISFLGGVLASVIVLAASIGLTSLAVRREWDLDNLVAPTVSTLGDVVTIPALIAASKLVNGGALTDALAVFGVLVSVAAAVVTLRRPLGEVRRIMLESLPILSVALVLSTLAGLVAEKRLNILAALPALLVLQPAFVSSAGSLGGILSSRVSSKLHLGYISAEMKPEREAQKDALLVLLIGFPIYVVNALGAQAVAMLFNQRSPGVFQMLATSLTGGLFTVLFVIGLSYYGTIAAWRLNLDPDTVGLPVVTASVDFVGVSILVLVVLALGLV
jgi:mgtE-like transporter